MTIDPAEISLLVRFIIAHLLTDFLLQKDSWVQDRFNTGWRSRYLYLHGLGAGIMVLVFSAQLSLWWVLPVVAVSHILIDGLKAGKADDLLMFLLDQLGHLVVLLVIWMMIIDLDMDQILALPVLWDTGTWLIILAYIIIIWPTGILVGKATARWRNEIETEDDPGLEGAGLWIGRMERFLIITFVLLEQYQAIGLLIAAKSIFRFSQDRKMGEYVLIGTLTSFVIAISVGLFLNLLL